MKIKTVLTLLFLFISVNVFAGQAARNKIVVFFAESFDNVSAKTIKKIESSDKFCLCVAFDESKYINKSIQNLIILRKIEPVIKVSEPYFPLISQDIKIGSSIVLNKVDDFKRFLQNYKNRYRSLFEIKKQGLYLKGAALNDDILNAFYKYNILWTTAKLQDDKKGLFVKNGVVLFSVYSDFPFNETKIKDWLSSLDGTQKIVPIFLTNSHVNNEQFMLSVINFFEKNKNIDVELPINAAYYGYNNKEISNKEFKLALLQEVPKENKLKLYLANREVEENKNSSQLYQILCDELSNMYSYDVINGIINKNKNSVRLFDISYTNIFRVLNKKNPNLKDFEQALNEDKENNSSDNKDVTVKTNCEFEKNDNGSITINNFGQYFTKFSVTKNNVSVGFKTDIDWNKTDYFDIYIDMNEIAYTGYQRTLKPLTAFFVPENSWEYALRVTKTNIEVYKFVSDNVELVETFPFDNNNKIEIPLSILRGNPYNWSYQVVVVKDNTIIDFIETENNKEKLSKSVPLQIKMFKYIK